MRILIVIGMCCSVLCSGQSKLERAKKRLQNRTETSTSSNNTNDSYAEDSTDKDETIGQKITQFLFIELIAKPVYHGAKYLLIGEKEVTVYNPTPYANGTYGEYIYFGDGNGTIDYDFNLNSLQAATSYTSGKYNINGLHTELEYRFNDLHGITAKYDRFSERHFGKTEVLEMGGVSYNYYRVREEFISAWWSLGIGGGAGSLGLRYGLGARLFIKKPISILLSWQQDLMEYETINEAKIQVDYHWKKMSFFAGFNHFNIARIGVPSMSIGLRYKFR